MTRTLTGALLGVDSHNRTRPSERRRQGKTDVLDAYRAARSVLSGEATTAPKQASIEPLRALNVARRSAVKAQQAARRQIDGLGVAGGHDHAGGVLAGAVVSRSWSSRHCLGPRNVGQVDGVPPPMAHRSDLIQADRAVE